MAENDNRRSGMSEENAEKFLENKEHPISKDEESRVKEESKSITSKDARSELDKAAKDNYKKRVDVADDGTVTKKTETSEIHSAADDLYKNIPLNALPTQGLFYKEDLEITIRPARVGEIRHWSTIDENDYIDMDKKLNFILEKCLRIKDGENGSFMSWRDLKEIDRFFIVFRIHELTFPKGENKINFKFKCKNPDCGDRVNGTVEKVPLASNMLDLIEIDKELMEYYNPEERMFTFEHKKIGKKFKATFPSVGVASKLKGYTNSKREEGDYIDIAFLRIAPYFIHEWRELTDEAIDSLVMESKSWSEDEVLFFTKLADLMEESVKLDAVHNCKSCSEEIRIPLFFRDGLRIKDLFSVSTSIGGLLGN